MILFIKSCKDCPFKFMGGFEDEEYNCSIDAEKRPVFKRDLVNHIDSIKFEDEKKWCKLNKHKITVQKEKPQQNLN
jgi:hypothetical protein